MSKLLNQRINMQVPSVKISTINEMMDLFGGPEELVVTLFFRIEGELTGSVYFVLTIDEANYLVKQVTGDESIQIFDGNTMNELARSVLQETANILTGAYLSSIADFTNIKMTTTIPYLSIDMVAATLVTGLTTLSHITDYVITIETKLAEDDEHMGTSGQFLLIPDPPSISKIFNAMGIDNNE